MNVGTISYDSAGQKVRQWLESGGVRIYVEIEVPNDDASLLRVLEAGEAHVTVECADGTPVLSLDGRFVIYWLSSYWVLVNGRRALEIRHTRQHSLILI